MTRIIKKGYSFDDVLLYPRYSSISSRKDVCFKTKVTKNFYLNIPFLAANMDTICEKEMAIALGKIGGLGVIHRFMPIEEQAKQVREVKKENLICAAAIGVKDYKERTKFLVEAGVDILVLDIAHAHSFKAGECLLWLKENFSVDVMVGNIATREAAKFFLDKGVDSLKIGIGPGSMCTTRIMTGAGVPQITAIMDVFEEVKGEIPICADGGIKNPGDVVKAIGAGADCVMVGKIIAGCLETPGRIIGYEGKKFKEYRGMASFEATLKKLKMEGKKESEIISIEGEKTLVDYKGPVENIIKKFLGGLASGMSYLGAKNIEDFKGNVDFIEISSAGFRESLPHGVFDSFFE
ncbi:MAG: IMP dehydrogenase [Candidatus Pacearchaeota archaeon]